MSDERKLELIQAVAAACRANGFFVKLICASAAEIRAQIALQVKLRAVAKAKEQARSRGSVYQEPKFTKKMLDKAIPPILDTVQTMSLRFFALLSSARLFLVFRFYSSGAYPTFLVFRYYSSGAHPTFSCV